MATYKVRAKIFVWQGQAAWHFAVVPQKVSATIKAKAGKQRRGFGSVKVAATIGKTTWLTSIFPDSKSGCYLLPLKLAVRLKEDISAGETVGVTLQTV